MSNKLQIRDRIQNTSKQIGENSGKFGTIVSYDGRYEIAYDDGAYGRGEEKDYTKIKVKYLVTYVINNRDPNAGFPTLSDAKKFIKFLRSNSNVVQESINLFEVKTHYKPVIIINLKKQ